MYVVLSPISITKFAVSLHIRIVEKLEFFPQKCFDSAEIQTADLTVAESMWRPPDHGPQMFFFKFLFNRLFSLELLDTLGITQK